MTITEQPPIVSTEERLPSRQDLLEPLRSANGHIIRRPIYKEDGTALIPLTKGTYAVVDAADAPSLTFHNWCAELSPSNGVYYACRREKGLYIRMHVELMGRRYVDHKDGNGLNNTRSNLRPATSTQNAGNMKMNKRNTSGYRGVVFAKQKRNKPWRAQLGVVQNGRQVCLGLGSYDTPEEAALAYNKAAVSYFGEDFVRLNVVERLKT